MCGFADNGGGVVRGGGGGLWRSPGFVETIFYTDLADYSGLNGLERVGLRAHLKAV